MLGSYGDYDWRPNFSKVTIPVLVVHGDLDAFPLEGSREWVAGRPNGRLLVFPGAGHWLQYERQKPLVAALDRFFKGGWPERAEALVGAGSGAGSSAAALADSFSTVIANRVELDIAAPASLVWSFLPSLRQRPRMERVPQNGLLDQFGARFDVIFRDSLGTVTRHDRVEVLHWEPGVRYTAHVNYLPPAGPIDIIYNVDLRETGGITHMVMNSYATLKLPDPGTDAGRVAATATERQTAQTAVEKGYQALKADIEYAAAKRSPPGDR
jgi:hypothetical protein